MPSLRRRRANARIMAEHIRLMELETQRVGIPRADGSVFGLGEKNLALRTQLGDPRVKTKHHWKGFHTIQDRLRELRESGMLWWGTAKQLTNRSACNPRYKIEQGPKAGTWRLYPSVRKVARKFFEAIGLSRRLDAEIEDLRRRRAAGEVAPIVDVARRRARDREIKARQRARIREQRMLEHQRRAGGLAAPQSPITRRNL